jgi:hypothetical protein
MQTSQQRQILTIEQRRAILEQMIQKYVRLGYRVLSQTDTSAQLVKPKQFSCLVATILLLLLILPLLIYLFMYMAEKDRTVYVTVDEYGRVQQRQG